MEKEEEEAWGSSGETDMVKPVTSNCLETLQQSDFTAVVLPRAQGSAVLFLSQLFPRSSEQHLCSTL